MRPTKKYYAVEAWRSRYEQILYKQKASADTLKLPIFLFTDKKTTAFNLCLRFLGKRTLVFGFCHISHRKGRQKNKPENSKIADLSFLEISSHRWPTVDLIYVLLPIT